MSQTKNHVNTDPPQWFPTRALLERGFGVIAAGEGAVAMECSEARDAAEPLYVMHTQDIPLPGARQPC